MASLEFLQSPNFIGLVVFIIILRRPSATHPLIHALQYSHFENPTGSLRDSLGVADEFPHIAWISREIPPRKGDIPIKRSGAEGKSFVQEEETLVLG